MKIDISDELFARLQKLATPFVDTPETVIVKAINLLEKSIHQPKGGKIPSSPRPTSPSPQSLKFKSYDELPSLKHTRPIQMLANHNTLQESTWNGLNQKIHILAASIIGINELLEISKANLIRGKKEENGFDYMSKIGCSIQRSDASTTVKQICHLAKELDLILEITFEWKDHEDAAIPGKKATLEITPTSKGLQA